MDLKKLATCAVSIGLFSFGCHQMGWAGWSLKWSKQSQNWPQGEGKLLEIRNERAPWRKQRHRLIVVRYSLTVDGKSYEGNRLHYSGNRANSGDARALLEELPRMRPLPVYYDPTDPSRNCLKNDGPREATYAAFVFGAGLLVASGIVIKPILRARI